MPDFAVSTAFLGRDKISGVFQKMGKNAGIFGDKSSKAFKRASKSGTGFGTVLKSILAAGFIQRGLSMLTSGLKEVGTQFISLDQSLTSASAKFGDLDLSTKKGQETLLQLKEAARTTGALTEKTATEAAGGLEFWALAGVNAAQAMTLLPGSVNLATIAERDLARSTDIASDSLGAFGLMTKDTGQLETNFTRLLDVMSATMTSSNTDIETMFETIRKSASVFTASGQSLETYNAILGTLANSSIKGSQAGTMMKDMLLRLADPSKESAAIISNLGIQVADSQGNFRDIIDILGDFEQATKNMGEVQRSAALSTVFGKKAITGINVIFKAGTNSIRDYRTELENSAGASQKMASIMRQSLQNRIAALKSAAIELGFQFMETFEKFGGSAIDKLTGILRTIPLKEIMQDLMRLGQPISQLVGSVIELGKAIFSILNVALQAFFGTGKKSVDIIEIISGAFGFVIGIIDNFAAGIRFLVALLKPVIPYIAAWAAIQWILNVAMSANPIGLIIVAIGLLIAGVGWVVTNWDNLVKGIKEGAGKIWKFIVGLLDNPFFNAVGDVFASVPDAILGAWEGVKTFFTFLYNNVLKPIGDFFSGVGKDIENLGESAGKGLMDMFKGAYEFGESVGKSIKGVSVGEIPGEKKEREAPNKTELETRRSIEMKGRIDINGAPPGTTAAFDIKGAPPVDVGGLGPNK